MEQETNTISPATPPNSASDDNDTPTTQTVEIGEERSPNEGGALAETATIPATPSPTSSPATGPSP